MERKNNLPAVLALQACMQTFFSFCKTSNHKIILIKGGLL